jgi:hypothetical protein
MNAYTLLLAQFLISVVLSLVVLFALSRPLVSVLCRVCPDDQAAAFWLSYTKVMLLIAPLLFVLVTGLLTHLSDPLDNIRFTLIATLGGLLIALRMIGTRLGQFIVTPKQEGSAT